jgi:hypothetical protein
MINITTRRCLGNGCMKHPTFNHPGAKIGLYCKDHAEDGMVDTINAFCNHTGCNTRAKFGFVGKIMSRCSTHRLQGMIKSPTRKCCTSRCINVGTHEFCGQRYCETHAPPNSENLGVATCTVCSLDGILTGGKCETCDPQVIQIRRHAKENRVKDVFTAAGLTFVHDRALEYQSCGRERPDFQFDCGTHWLYVEVDEHQHETYACECEQARMVNLVEVRGMPVRWIRYNPDVYEPIKGQRVATLEQREKKLLEYVKWAMQHPPQDEKMISTVLYLYYDEHDTKKQEWQTLIEMARCV